MGSAVACIYFGSYPLFRKVKIKRGYPNLECQCLKKLCQTQQALGVSEAILFKKLNFLIKSYNSSAVNVSLSAYLGASVRHFVPISKKQTILMLKLGCHGRHISCTSRFWLRPNKTNPNCSGRKKECNGSRIKVSKINKNFDMKLCI